MSGVIEEADDAYQTARLIVPDEQLAGCILLKMRAFDRS
jgi:hypothetical protein